MKFTERIEFEYDPEVFGLQDTQTALRIYSEYVSKHSPQRPPPKFMEVDRRSSKFDHLWHTPLDDRTVFSRVFNMAAIIQQQKPQWRRTRVGLVPMQKITVWMGHLLLQQADWWPMLGDMLFWNGYRHMIVDVNPDPNSYWQQTNVWMGLLVTAVIPPEGDARPLLDPAQVVPAELHQTRPVPEV